MSDSEMSDDDEEHQSDIYNEDFQSDGESALPLQDEILAACKSLSYSKSDNDAIGAKIGIMIGTTNMSVAAFHNNRISIIPNEKGARHTPAVIAFTPKGRIIGHEAVDQRLTNASNTIGGVVQMIGKKLDELQHNYPANKFLLHSGKPVVKVQQNQKTKKLTAEQLTSFLIKKLMDIVQQYCGIIVTEAVIAVPPRITQAHKNVILSAADSAGLRDTVRLLDQPIAACMAHGLDKGHKEHNIMVLHCGGETTTVTFVRKSYWQLIIRGTATNHQLGGRHFDDQLFRHCNKKFQLDHKVDLKKNAKDSARLREAVVKAKITLSSLDEAVISIAGLHGGKDFRDRICLSQFEKLCSKLFVSVWDVVEDALRKTKFRRKDIDKIVLTGGSSRITKIKRMMERNFEMATILRSDDFTPDQAVVYGTIADQAAAKPKKRKQVEETKLELKKRRVAEGKGSEAVIGIDLGTTYSSVGVYQNGEAVIIPNEQGNRITPSCVAFTARGRLIGDPAKDHAAIDPKNTVFEIKRLMGLKCDDLAVQDDIENWLFSVLTRTSKPLIEVNFRNQKKRFCAEEISGFILSKLKDVAEKYTGKKIKKAVVTVPARFNDFQRVATKTAAEIAGLTDVRILTEPTAAAIAHGLDRNEKNERNILVYDFGGGTLDVSLLSIQDRNIDVITTAGDTHLGGKDFDSRLVDHFCKQFLLKHGQDISSDLKAVSRLRQECEKAKIRLSDFGEAEVDIDSLFKGIRFLDTITRTAFENLCGDLFLKTLKPLVQALADAKISKDAIDDLVLVGGSTRIPKIRELVTMYFNGKKFRQDVHPEEAVVRGAVMRSAMLFADTELSDVQVQEVTPLSLGIEVFGGRMSTVIPRNTAIPVTRTQMYTTTADGQKSVLLSAFQGERKFADDNIFLDEFVLKGVPPDRRGKSEFPVKFKLDGNGVLEVASQPKPGAPFQKMRIKDPCDLPKSEVDRMIAKAKKMRHYDRKELARVAVRNKLYFKCYDNRNDEDIGEACQEVLEWLRDTPDAEQEILQRKLNHILSFYH